MPMPVSRTEKCRCNATGRALPPRASKEFGLDKYVALLRELDGVAQQVHHHLAHPQRIALDDCRNGDVRLTGQIQVFFRSPGGQQIKRLLDARPQIKRTRTPLHLARLDLGEVQDVVDDGQQGFAAGLDCFQIAALLRPSSGVSISRPAMAMTPFIGVRISWLIAARKSDLARTPDSAASAHRSTRDFASSFLQRAVSFSARPAGGRATGRFPCSC